MKLRKLIYLLPVLMVPMISVPILMTSCSDENTKQENNNTQGDSNNSNSGDNSTGGGSSDNNTTPPSSGGGSGNGGNNNTGGGGTGSGGSTGDNNGTTSNPIYEKYKEWDGKDVKLIYTDENNNCVSVLGRIKFYPKEQYFLVVTATTLHYDDLSRIVRIGDIKDDSINPTKVEMYQGFKGKNVKVTFTDNATLSTGNLIDLTNDYVFLGGSGHYGEAYSLPWSVITKIELNNIDKNQK